MLCEATEQVGGTTSTSAGTLWLPGNRHGRMAGHDDTAEAGRQYLDALIGPDDHLGRRDAFLETADEAIAFLETQCGLAFVSAGRHPDYLELPGAALCGRAISPVEFDGRRLGPDFERVRPPLKDFLLLGGMMANKTDVQALVQRYRSWPAFVRTGQLVARYLRDRLSYSRGTRLVMGNALVAQMLLGLRQIDVETRFGTRLLKLERTANRVSAIVVESNGVSERISARAAVVLATGGIGRNPDLRRKLDHAEFDSLTSGCTRRCSDGCPASGRQYLSVRHVTISGNQYPASQTALAVHRLFPHLYLDRAKPGLIAVNKAGKRFVNEGASYHHFVEGMLGNDAAGAAFLPISFATTSLWRSTGSESSPREQRIFTPSSAVDISSLPQPSPSSRRSLASTPQVSKSLLRNRLILLVKEVTPEFGKGAHCCQSLQR
ncbi:FAD-binding protein [Cupriavidus basilensis]